LLPQFSDSQPRGREGRRRTGSCRHFELTILAGPTGAYIVLGKTPLLSNSGRIASVTSPVTKRAAGAFARTKLAWETTMNWDQIQGNWLIFKGKLRQNWVKLTDEDITRINGRREELAARLQERYGFARAEADREIGAWVRSQRHAADYAPTG
jgi:uncharacterized protein YjbJ (UPF0337 family)